MKILLLLSLVTPLFCIAARHQISSLSNPTLKVDALNAVRGQSIRSLSGISDPHQALVILMKFKSQVSHSLCTQFNMTKCGQTCCTSEQLYHQRSRIHCTQNMQFSYRSPIQNYKINPVDAQKLACQRTGRVYCGGVCCQSQKCDKKIENTDNNTNLRYTNQKCVQQKINIQKQCKQIGLLWCDGECCGFSSVKHKCFSVNHYGTPYIRCPIEKPRI